MTTPRRHRERPRRRNRIVGGIAGLVLVATVVALVVGGGDEDATRGAADGSGPSPAASTDGATAVPTTGSPSVTGAPTAPGGGAIDPKSDAILTPTELERFQLRGSDLPPGWRTLDTVRAATDTLIGPCLRKATTPTVPHVLTTTSFRSGSSGPVLTSSVRDHTSPAASARAMTAVRDAVLACARGTSKPTLQTFALSSRADASVAVTFTLTQDGSSARGEVIVARVGARSVTLALIGLDAKDLEIGRDAVRTVVARFAG